MCSFYSNDDGDKLGPNSNHPLAHLMQSVFSIHDPERFKVYIYATCKSDGSYYRQRIEADSHYFADVSTWKTSSIVERITEDQIHICAILIFFAMLFFLNSVI